MTGLLPGKAGTVFMTEVHILNKYRAKCRAALPAAVLTLGCLLAACGKDGGVLLQRAGDTGSAALSAAEGVSPAEGIGLAEGVSPAEGISPAEDAKGPGEENPSVTVFVCGEVNEPGVYVLEEGARVFEAVAAAGGFTADAQEDYINLAQYVQDTQKIYIPGKEEAAFYAAGEVLAQTQAGVQDTGMPAQPPEGTGGRININTAGLAELVTIPGIGEARARTILEYRQTNGPFESPEDIMKVSGIKQATYEKLCDFICVR